MKKSTITILIFISILICNVTTAQKSRGPVDPVSKGDWILNLDIGAAASYYSEAGSGPGFQISFEKGMWQLGPGALTLGGEFGFSYFAHKQYYYKHSWFTTILAARSAYHYGWKVPGLDTYGGLTLGFRFLSLHENYYYNYVDFYNPAPFAPHFGAFIGASYFFGPKVGINGEFGYNINFAQIGVVFKLN